MRLAIVTPYPPSITGIGQYGFHVSRLLACSGAFTQVTVLTGHNGVAEVNVPSPIGVEHGWDAGGWRIGQAIPKALGRIQPDLVWFNLGVSVFGREPLANLSGFLSILGVKRQGLPSVVTLHELPELADLRALRAPGGFLARHGARLLTDIAMRGDVTCLTTRHYADWLAKRHRAPATLVHIPLGAYGMPDPLPEADSPELLLFTTLAPFKGVELLVQAFQILKDFIPNLKLTIAGAEHARFPGYMERVRQIYHNVDGVRWLGQVPDSEIRGLFRRAQLVILPYLASTGSSSVLWQAAMYGRAMVVADLEDIRSTAHDAGFELAFFKRGDIQSLVQTVHTMLFFPEYRHTQTHANLATIRRHRPEDTCRAYLRAFNLALEAQRSPKRISLSPLSEELA
jgi:glycosyltransferase involved in cell wall biosynthesis